MSETTLDAQTPLPQRRANRPITIGHRLEYILVLLLIGLFRILGVDAASALAGGVARAFGPLIKPIHRRADESLKRSFPDWSEERRRQVAAGVWENLGRTSAEFAHLDKFRPFELGGRVDVDGADRLFEVAKGGTPVIYVSGHFANWEVMPITIHRSGVDYGFVYRAANNPLVDGLIIRARGRVMSRLQIPKGKRGGRQLIDAMKSGKSLAMLVDQKLNDGIAAPFLGREAMTAPAAARLSLKFGAPIVPMSLARTNGAHFRITVHQPIAFTPTGDATADVLHLTTLVNQALERDIRARPEQWLWLHRRWPEDKR
jgi:KDO2-lipid IV(A) lauroyltransferase